MAKKVGTLIKEARTEAGLTQEQVAAKLQVNGCDITRSAVAKIEVGQRHLYPDEIIVIKKILKVSLKRSSSRWISDMIWLSLSLAPRPKPFVQQGNPEQNHQKPNKPNIVASISVIVMCLPNITGKCTMIM